MPAATFTSISWRQVAKRSVHASITSSCAPMAEGVIVAVQRLLSAGASGTLHQTSELA